MSSLIVPLFILVSLGGLEPPTHSLEGCCSIQLSYRPRKWKGGLVTAFQVERVMGIEPTQSAWKAEVLPLNYTRKLLPCTTLKNFTVKFLFCLYLFRYSAIIFP